jgi:uncharacterized membrane protein
MEQPDLASAVFWLAWIGCAKTISAFLVAIGVAGEFLGDYLARPFQRRIDAAREAGVAQLTKDSQQAQARIAEAQANVADAQAKAAQANRIAEEERLARIKIEQRMAPRTLTIEQRQRVIDTIKPFGRQDYSPGVTNQTEAIDSFA